MVLIAIVLVVVMIAALKLFLPSASNFSKQSTAKWAKAYWKALTVQCGNDVYQPDWAHFQSDFEEWDDWMIIQYEEFNPFNQDRLTQADRENCSADETGHSVCVSRHLSTTAQAKRLRIYMNKTVTGERWTKWFPAHYGDQLPATYFTVQADIIQRGNAVIVISGPLLEDVRSTTLTCDVIARLPR